MSQFSIKPPSGTRDFLPQDIIFRNQIQNKIENVFHQHNFLPVQTPSFENIETLTGKYGDEGEKLIFKILKRGDKEKTGEADLALRYDLTVPFLRFYARHQNELPKIFKRYQIGPVWRADRPGKGRYREFYQCDIDIMGSYSILAEVEVISTLALSLNKIGISDFTVKINSRKILRTLMSIFGLAEKHQNDVLILLDKIDKIGVEEALLTLQKTEWPQTAKSQLIALLTSAAPSEHVKEILIKAGFQNLWDDVTTLLKLLNQTCPHCCFVFDPFLARGLDYYTGFIFEIFSDKAKGAIASGGRTDNLGDMFMKTSVPLVGGSLGFERLCLLLENDMFPFLPAIDVYITLWDETFSHDILKIQNILRGFNLKTEIDLTGQKLKHQLKLADQLRSSFCLVYGPDEAQEKCILIKNMKTQEQKKIRISELSLHHFS